MTKRFSLMMDKFLIWVDTTGRRDFRGLWDSGNNCPAIKYNPTFEVSYNCLSRVVTTRRRYLTYPSRSFQLFRRSYSFWNHSYVWALKWKSTVLKFNTETFFGWLPPRMGSMSTRCTVITDYLVYMQFEAEQLLSGERRYYLSARKLSYNMTTCS